jgi:hypothetical protein
MVADLSASFSYAFATILFVDDLDGNGMGRRARARTAAMADFAVTALGVAGFLGFLNVANSQQLHIRRRAPNSGRIWDETLGYMIRDRDRSYGAMVIHRLRAMGIQERFATPASR